MTVYTPVRPLHYHYPGVFLLFEVNNIAVVGYLEKVVLQISLYTIFLSISIQA